MYIVFANSVNKSDFSVEIIGLSLTALDDLRDNDKVILFHILHLGKSNYCLISYSGRLGTGMMAKYGLYRTKGFIEEYSLSQFGVDQINIKRFFAFQKC